MPRFWAARATVGWKMVAFASRHNGKGVVLTTRGRRAPRPAYVDRHPEPGRTSRDARQRSARQLVEPEPRLAPSMTPEPVSPPWRRLRPAFAAAVTSPPTTGCGREQRRATSAEPESTVLGVGGRQAGRSDTARTHQFPDQGIRRRGAHTQGCLHTAPVQALADACELTAVHQIRQQVLRCRRGRGGKVGEPPEAVRAA